MQPPPPARTYSHLVMEEQAGTASGSIACWADGTGGLFKEITITFHFENGTWFSKRKLPGTWDGDSTWEEIDTDYDPNFNGGSGGSGYGDPVDPDSGLPSIFNETYSFSDEVTQSMVETHANSATLAWGSPSGVNAIDTVSPAEAFEHANTVSGFLTGTTTFTVTKSDNVEATLGGWAYDVTGLRAIFTNKGPTSAKLFYQAYPAAATTMSLPPGSSHTTPEAGLVIDEHHAIELTAIQWLPWAS